MPVLYANRRILTASRREEKQVVYIQFIWFWDVFVYCFF